MRFRSGVVLAALLVLASLGAATRAMAAAEVHKLSLVLSGIPTQVKSGGFNDALDAFNVRILDPRGYEELPHLQFAWEFDAELRYFVRQNFAITAGIAQIRVQDQKEFLPALAEGIDYSAEILTAPVHIGGAYYLQPYNQGDFQARAFFGGGMIQYTHSRASFQQTLTNPDTTLSAQLGQTYRQVLTADAPGYYAEFGAHMFFAARYSALVSLVYRTGELHQLVLVPNSDTAQTPGGQSGAGFFSYMQKPLTVDVGGVGVRMAIGIGF